MALLAGGFECGLVGNGMLDMLDLTNHTPEGKMRQHYRMARAHGITMVRDGLVAGHNVRDRLRIAEEEKMEVIWDLSHYHTYADPDAHICSIMDAFYDLGLEGIRVCPVNEPEIVPLMTNMSTAQAVVVGRRMLDILKANVPNVIVTTSNAAPTLDGWTDPFAADADVIGINVYPHTIQAPIRDIICATYCRYGKPVMITETSWHDGFHTGGNKADWLNHVINEVQIAEQRGADVTYICWYPLIDSPPWSDAKGERWSHGLIKHDLSADPTLSEKFHDFNSIRPIL